VRFTGTFMPSPEMEGTAVLISIQCRCNLTSKGCLCHGKQGTSESISPWKRIIIFQTIPGFRALFGRILVRTGTVLFSQNCNQLFAIQLRSFHMPTAVIEKGATIFFLSPDWPLMHHSMDQVLVPSTASGRDLLASMPLAGDSSGRVNHMCVKM